jgi:hypothetical protein
MSIAVLTQVYDEMRRLAIAGSVVANGDFRLKKLIRPLEQAGGKAPVFVKVAEAVKAVVECNEQTSAQALLELTTLVNAILYTQGETGVSGTLEPIQTSDLGAPTAQASARVIKPLLDALTTTGSGRLEVISDAHERGAFRDLRLVKPALDAIDDGYGEIGDFIAQNVLPLYGKAILPELRAKVDLKGRAGHARRLRLLHALDPAGTRDLVKLALDSGSKEVKIVAIECLGADRDDLAYLLEQSSAKAQEVRQAAYHALANIDEDAAVLVLQKAMNSKDLEVAAEALGQSRSSKLLRAILAAADSELVALRKTMEKKEVSQKIDRLISLMNCLAGREDQESEAFLLKVFMARADLAKIKGATTSGSDLNSAVVHLLELGTQTLQTTLVDAQASLSGEDLHWCFEAARRALPAYKVFETFSSYLTAKVDEKKKQRDPAWVKREAIIGALCQRYHYYHRPTQIDERPALDPRWLDLAVEMEHLGLVRQLIRPGHPAANAFLKKEFGETFKKAKQIYDCHDVLAAMIYAAHPEATDAVLAVLEKFGKKTAYFGYWTVSLIVDLPKSALPRLEALLPTLNDKVADSLLGYIQQLRKKKD